MNRWIEYSIAYANQRSYLDDLFRVYPTIPDGIRTMNRSAWDQVEQAFHKQDNKRLIESLLRLKLFPIKDSYVAYLKRDKSALDRNPQTINRLCGRLYEMGIDKIWENCSLPKETNRQIGPMFKDWVRRGNLGLKPVPMAKFCLTGENAILDASDKVMQEFAQRELGYHRSKGLDFVGRFNGRYVIGEAKFLTDFGGHQNAQFDDAISTLMSPCNEKTVSIAIFDGVLYIPGKNKMYESLTGVYRDSNIMSALVLREFLYQL